MYNQMFPQNRFNTYPQTNGITWVQGVEGAKAFQLMPNSNTILMDSESEDTFYIKISDNVGMCTLRTFQYKEITDKPKSSHSVDMSKYVTREELNEILGKRGGNNGKQSFSADAKPTITK